MDTRPLSYNLVETARADATAERFDTLVSGSRFRLERIVSLGHATPEDDWYDQERPEWVMLVAGRARLKFEGEERDRVLEAGDTVLIPAHARHRVAWTDPDQVTIWLALHFDPDQDPLPTG